MQSQKRQSDGINQEIGTGIFPENFIAAALAATHDVPIANISIEKLQKALADTGVIIHFDDSWVPAAEKQDSYAATADHI